MPTAAIHTLETPEQLDAILKQNPAVLLLFSAPSCGVCQVLKPQIAAMLAKDFPQMQLVYIDCETHLELAARYQVFSLPVVETIFYGKSFARFSKVFSLGDLKEAIARPYELLNAE
ncbi:thioredoxin family protein [Shewanella xiamenensis]|uniref:thioredoxin family protein n=1 Tax=Shewanella xiamenensis TaxID=332186 RepID=UPI001C4E85A8|nr:thioredoxin family protein [Shewanella xiamenensis]MBW0278857.1 thiol reductase thioredoxin [Shewanella xiamenensis]MCT8871273.1 thioredoxin family protein [Shewanella xiamenensis]UWH41541.1 thioredoxin family protein [Shewanella xiamenensis]